MGGEGITVSETRPNEYDNLITPNNESSAIGTILSGVEGESERKDQHNGNDHHRQINNNNNNNNNLNNSNDTHSTLTKIKNEHPCEAQDEPKDTKEIGSPPNASIFAADEARVSCESSSSSFDLSSSSSEGKKSQSGVWSDSSDNDGPLTVESIPKIRSEVLVPTNLDIPSITVGEETEMKQLGVVEKVIFSEIFSLITILIQSFSPIVIDLNTPLFLANRSVIGSVNDVLGKTDAPCYTVCFKDKSAFEKFEITVATPIFYAPQVSKKVFLPDIYKPGCDASYIHDQEVPSDELEFSDDEKEELFKRAKKIAKTEQKPKKKKNGSRESVKSNNTPSLQNYKGAHPLSTTPRQNPTQFGPLQTTDLRQNLSPLGLLPTPTGFGSQQKELSSSADQRSLAPASQILPPSSIDSRFLPPSSSSFDNRFLPPSSSSIDHRFLPPSSSSIDHRFLPPSPSSFDNRFLPPSPSSFDNRFLPPSSSSMDQPSAQHCTQGQQAISQYPNHPRGYPPPQQNYFRSPYDHNAALSLAPFDSRFVPSTRLSHSNAVISMSTTSSANQNGTSPQHLDEMSFYSGSSKVSSNTPYSLNININTQNAHSQPPACYFYPQSDPRFIPPTRPPPPPRSSIQANPSVPPSQNIYFNAQQMKRD